MNVAGSWSNSNHVHSTKPTTSPVIQCIVAWERRKGGLYYYRKIRVGDKVFSQYIGRNVYAEFLDEEIDERRQARKARAEEKKRWQEVEHQLDRLKRQNEAELLAAGLHRPNWGNWRRKRKPPSKP